MGTLIFRDKPLGQAVEEINHYASNKLKISDSAIAQVRVSGEFDYTRPDLAERFVLALERQGKARRTPAEKYPIDPGRSRIELVSMDADPALYGSAENQITQDVCESYRNTPPAYPREEPEDAKRAANFDIAGCDLETSLRAFNAQSGLPYEIAIFPAHRTFTQPLQGWYTGKEALEALLAGTECRASGEVSTGLRIICNRQSASITPKRGRPMGAAPQDTGNVSTAARNFQRARGMTPADS
jgi:hypothetical protein